MNDLVLRYRFTDRGGRAVYDVIDPAIDALMGQMRMKFGVDVSWSDFTLDWCDDVDDPEAED
jgi:hypothetical protein